MTGRNLIGCFKDSLPFPPGEATKLVHNINKRLKIIHNYSTKIILFLVQALLMILSPFTPSSSVPPIRIGSAGPSHVCKLQTDVQTGKNCAMKQPFFINHLDSIIVNYKVGN